ncbi:TonB-dependent receptor [Stigmatella sp. ncwal1]|uniref:TonB-dependent receptor n=1 Tax=Stigmatella ashevillensis TaxID=2995309 RepID=A0ABT5DIZ1_9BACT|nr:TonB-dependent receptor [Stigmatella ashevillena]MDC0712307.1 TonB-dependent receptor [Stigmatella ashevillena]
MSAFWLWCALLAFSPSESGPGEEDPVVPTLGTVPEGPEPHSVTAAETEAVPSPEPEERPASEEPREPPQAEASPTAGTTVRAARPARSASEVTLDREILQSAPRTGAVDLLRLVPGLVVSQHGGEGKAHQLFLRGFDALHGQDVELNVGGLPVNEVSHIHALGYADLNFVIPEVVRELRVTEGTYRAFQGDFAVAGTVRVELGLDEPGVLLAGTVGQYGQRRVVAAVRPGENEETFAAVELGEGRGFGPRRSFGKASLLAQAATELETGAGAVRVRALAGSYTTRFDTPGVVREDDVLAGREDFYAAPLGRQGGSAVRHQLLLGMELPRSGSSRTVVEVFGVLTDLRLRNNFTGFRVDERGDGLEQTHDSRTLGVRLEHRRRFEVWGREVAGELGLGARRDGAEQTQRRYRESDGTFFAEEVDASFVQTDVWGYAEAQVPLGRWRLLLGGRADALGVNVFDALAFRDPRYYDGRGYARSAFGVHAGAKAGLELALTERWRLFASYGDGFRSPQARSLAEGERAPFVSVRGAELGARREGERLAVQVSLFGSQVKDDFFFDHTVGTTVFTGETVRAGATAALQARPWEGVTAALSATGAHARVTATDTLLPYFAPLVARADVGWERTLRVGGETLDVSAGTGLTLIGPRPLPFDEYSRTVFLTDVQGRVRWGALGLRLEVKNLLDARWRDGEFVYGSRMDPSTPASLVPSRHFTAGTPRTASLTLEVHL